MCNFFRTASRGLKAVQTQFCGRRHRSKETAKKRWLANPADNQGWAFISDDSDSWGFKTSMDDKLAEHPKLVVVAANCS